MRTRTLQYILCGTLLVSLPVVATAQEDRIDVVLGFGLIISPDYNDVLEDAYSDYSTSGGYGWMDIQFGVRVNTTDQLSFTPSVDLLVNFGTGDESFVNTIVLPSIACRYTFKEVPSFYLRGEVNYGIPNIGADRIDAKSGGVGFGGAVGYASDVGIDLELGYLHVPVEINDVRDENFGGFLIKVSGSF